MNKTKTLTTLLLLLATLTAQAQENKGAQRMHKAMVEFVCKFSDPRSACLASITAPEELLPDRKQHVVKVAKRKLLKFPENHLYVNPERALILPEGQASVPTDTLWGYLEKHLDKGKCVKL